MPNYVARSVKIAKSKTRRIPINFCHQEYGCRSYLVLFAIIQSEIYYTSNAGNFVILFFPLERTNFVDLDGVRSRRERFPFRQWFLYQHVGSHWV